MSSQRPPQNKTNKQTKTKSNNKIKQQRQNYSNPRPTTGKTTISDKQ